MKAHKAMLMAPIPSGRIFMKDEGAGRVWRADVAAFELATVPVTQAVWHGVMGGEVVDGSGALPMVDVSWNAAVRFCNALSVKGNMEPAYRVEGEGDDVSLIPGAGGYRLPTEAEWEYACRGGSSESRYGDLEEIAWFEGNANGRSHPVAQKAPNAYGLYDMLGNAWEWCWDLYDVERYGRYRVFRGGGFSDPPRACRASCRRKSHPTFEIDDLGFRLARSRLAS